MLPHMQRAALRDTERERERERERKREREREAFNLTTLSIANFIQRPWRLKNISVLSMTRRSHGTVDNRSTGRKNLAYVVPLSPSKTQCGLVWYRIKASDVTGRQLTAWCSNIMQLWKNKTSLSLSFLRKKNHTTKKRKRNRIQNIVIIVVIKFAMK